MLAKYTGLIVFIILLGIHSNNVHAGWSIDIESGAAFNGYNDVRIPGNTGTDISLSEDLKSDAAGFIRLRLARDFGDRHQLSLLVAPLRIRAAGSLDRDVNFNGVWFTAGEDLSAHYRFDSYRLTYHYTLLNSDRLRTGIGLTAKVRDASIKIKGNNDFSEKTNTGFVPLINFAVDWRFGSKLGLIFEGDALAAPQGRAEDVLLAIYGKPMENVRIRLGYRILEGGADNDEVYNFALIHYLSAGMTWMF
jgi:hypothetical protein